MDLIDRLQDSIETLDLSFKVVQNINTEDDSITVMSLPGSTVTRAYFDGVKDKAMNYEIRGVTIDKVDVAEKELFIIADFLGSLTSLTSLDGSFEFSDIVVSDEPYFLDAQEDGSVVFGLTFVANVTIF
ncbi:hypothetical protein EC99P2_00008 [Enterococcus phage EC99P2]|nr:hypothetical protein EC99P2_00008 [Enterococcus phage EC99P2]